jgi:hypothetical protein
MALPFGGRDRHPCAVTLTDGSTPLDHRESSDTYQGELLRLGDWRVAICRDRIQWLLQRRRPGKAGVGAAWDSLGFARTRAALLRLWRAHTGEDGSELRTLLPEHVRKGVPHGR